MESFIRHLKHGVIDENPTFVQVLGMCPTLAVTTSAVNGLGMGLSVLVVLTLSNLLISLVRKVVPDKIRIPAFIVINSRDRQIYRNRPVEAEDDRANQYHDHFHGRIHFLKTNDHLSSPSSIR